MRNARAAVANRWRRRDEEPVEAAGAVDAQERAHRSLENYRTVFHTYHRHSPPRGHFYRVKDGDISNESRHTSIKALTPGIIVSNLRRFP